MKKEIYTLLKCFGKNYVLVLKKKLKEAELKPKQADSYISDASN